MGARAAWGSDLGESPLGAGGLEGGPEEGLEGGLRPVSRAGIRVSDGRRVGSGRGDRLEVLDRTSSARCVGEACGLHVLPVERVRR